MTVDQLDTFLEAMAPEHTAVQRDMAARADDEGFPIIGRAAGAVLQQYAMATDATRIFEFGSGYGYSATWFAPALAADGDIVLTEEDPDELALAEEYLERAGLVDKAHFEVGDALDTIEAYDGPFDVVLIDAAKEQYVDCYESVKPKLRAGSVVIADNALTAGDMDTLGIVDGVISGEASSDLDSMAAGIRDYLLHVSDDPDVVSSVVPVGSGLAISVRR